MLADRSASSVAMPSEQSRCGSLITHQFSASTPRLKQLDSRAKVIIYLDIDIRSSIAVKILTNLRHRNRS